MSRRRTRSRSPSPRRERERLPSPPPRRYDDAPRSPPRAHRGHRDGGREWDRDRDREAQRYPPRSERGGYGGHGEHGGGHGNRGGGHSHHQGGGYGGDGPPRRNGGGQEWIGGDVKSYGVRLEPHPSSLDADIEESISATDFQEFRKVKRQELMKQNRYCIWDNTPSPSVSPERGPSSDEEAVTAAHVESGHANAPPEGEAPEDEGLSAKEVVPAAQPEELVGPAAELDKQEAAILKSYLMELRIEADRAEEARVKAAEENAFVGPELPHQAKAAANSYGKALLPGEGEAMAAFVQSGKRIPRRGEVGMTADEIQNYEDLGYIMSGSRHSRMNAIRIRKENQVYTAEEKAALAQLNFEEKAKKEQRVLNDMRKLVEQSQHGSGSGK
mmetsp:Transcript_1044/g.2702  ORF Transcript_1044/g.2702 Transcript_1044/m.2702 type:complete len:386 (-) Transcript_1044:55-1212(-)